MHGRTYIQDKRMTIDDAREGTLGPYNNANDLVHAHLCIVIVRSTFMKNTVMEVSLPKQRSL